MQKSNFKIFSQSPIILIILVIGVIFLGYKIFTDQKATQPTASPAPQLISTTLSEDEKFILHPPTADASASAKDKHAQVVAKLAKTAEAIELKSCVPTPTVLQVKANTEFKVKNLDSIDHKLTFDSEHIYTIKANGETKIKADFKYGTGDYGYVCEGVGLTGFVHIVP